MAPSHEKLPSAAQSTAVAGHDVIKVEAEVFSRTCLQLVQQVHDDGIEVAITKHGAVVARVVPPDGRGRSAFGFMRGTLVAHDDIVSPDFGAWATLR